MVDTVKGLFGFKTSAQAQAEKMARQQAEQQRATQLAALANQNAQVDQERSSIVPRGQSGRRLLTFLSADNQGASTLGGG